MGSSSGMASGGLAFVPFEVGCGRWVGPAPKGGLANLILGYLVPQSGQVRFVPSSAMLACTAKSSPYIIDDDTRLDQRLAQARGAVTFHPYTGTLELRRGSRFGHHSLRAAPRLLGSWISLCSRATRISLRSHPVWRVSLEGPAKRLEAGGALPLESEARSRLDRTMPRNCRDSYAVAATVFWLVRRQQILVNGTR